MKSKPDTQDRSLNFWAERAPGYNQLEWANSQGLIQAMLHAAELKPNFTVLDVGTGTGIVAKAMSPKVDRVVGIDFSLEMMQRFDGNMPPNCFMLKADIRETLFHDNFFDVVTARYAFHHFVGFAKPAAQECYRVLKPQGKLVICEGTPPSEGLRNDYAAIFALKEKRLTLMEEDIQSLMEEAGFKDVKTEIMWLRQMSVRNWLNSSGLPADTKEIIYGMHVNASKDFKDCYNLKVVGNDCLIDMRQAIVAGVK